MFLLHILAPHFVFVVALPCGIRPLKIAAELLHYAVIKLICLRET